MTSMQLARWVWIRLAVAVAVTSVPALGDPAAAVSRGTAAAGKSTARPSYYLAMGDSVPVWNGAESYPYRLLGRYKRSLPGLTLDDVGSSGETSDSMLMDGQYKRALSLLRAHSGHVALITMDIGGNDIVGCVSATGLDPACARQAEATIKRNLRTMLAGLRAAAPHVPIFGMTYYNPFVGNWLAGGAIRSLTLQTTPVLLALNHELTKLYGGRRRTADVQGAFGATDFKTIVPSPWGMVPVAVRRACSWLDIVCHRGDVEGFGDDPNLKGAAVIASAFERKIGSLRPR